MQSVKELNLTISHDFPVSTHLLYEAWVTEEHLRAWWHPMGNRLRSLTNELQQGGEVRYEFETEEGADAFVISGTYEEVKEAELLVYSWNWQVPNGAVHDSDFRLTIRFQQAGEGSRLEVKQENFTSEESIQPHREGWESALKDLHQHLAQSGQ